MTIRFQPRCVFCACLLMAVPACVVDKEDRKKLDLGVAAIETSFAKSAAYRDTIGSVTYYQGMAPMRVRGYGLVVGLGKNGSRDCPKPIYEKLIQDLYKHYRFSSELVGSKFVSPEQMIEDLDTAVVLVQGTIAPAASVGSRFDIAVAAVPGTQTKSLAGGRLYTTELEMYRQVGSGSSLSGQVLAKGSGPVFLNPFSDAGSPTRSPQLEGTILGGGVVTQDRRVRLVLNEPSYQYARLIQQRIGSLGNEDARKIADAVSPSFIQINIPKDQRDDTAHFLGLVRHLYLTQEPGFAGARARELAEELVRPNAPHSDIALAFEGLGRPALPVLNDLYTHGKDYVTFHAAAAGLRLGDHLACDVMTLHAEKIDGEFRYRAVRALGDARGMAGAGMCLRRMLDDDDPRIRIAAYEALLERGDSVIRSKSVGGDNFIIDRISSDKPGLVYAKRNDVRRIALFGDDLRCEPPLLYRAPDGSITLSAGAADESVTVMRVVVATGSTSPPIPAPFDLNNLIRMLGGDAEIDDDGNATGVALDYGGVVRALYHLSKDKALPASFILEEPNAAELFGAPELKGRPESEL